MDCDYFESSIYLFLATLGPCYFAFSGCGKQGLLCVVECRLLTEVVSLSAEHRVQSVDSAVVAHRLHRPAACGIFLDQGSNPCPLHWQADS